MIKKVRIACLLFVTLLVLYTLLRICFYYIYFNGQSKGADLAGIFYWGMRLDFTALFYVNLPFWIYFFFLHNWLPVTIRSKIAMVLFLLLNIPFLAINFIDLVYFNFNNRRSTSDLLFVTGDSMHAIGAFVKDYWYLFLSFAILVLLLFITVKTVFNRMSFTITTPWYKQYIVALIPLLSFGVIARGTATRPIMPSTPLLYFESFYQPLASNSTITFLYSLVKRQTQLEIKHYYTSQELDSLFPIKRQYVHDKAFQRKNVVIIMLESFCREYLEPGNAYRAQTPFLDSIIAQSTWCSNGYANGFTSNQGIVSILGSLPPLTDEPYYQSVYSNNKIRGIGTILKDQGYSTHFFYGASPDHFGFSKFCKIVGIDHQHTSQDFNDEKYFDGSWGIYDHQFLPFAGRMLQKEDSPFLAVLFNISSHPPFSLPADLSDRFNFQGQQPFQKSVAYVDYSLQLFFDEIKNTNWYKNTLFVFCADHSIMHAIKRPVNVLASVRIPIFLYDPADPVYRNVSKMVQQMDIVPTILDRLAYSDPFMSFGHSLYDTAGSYAVSKFYGLQLCDSSFLFRFNQDMDEPVCLYNTSTDSAMKINLLNIQDFSDKKNKMLRYSKAMIQRYNNSLIQNQLYVK